MSVENAVQTAPHIIDRVSPFIVKDKQKELSFYDKEISRALGQVKSNIYDYVIHSKEKKRTGNHFWRVDDDFGRWGVNKPKDGLRSVSFFNPDRSLPVVAFKAWTNGHGPTEMYSPHFKFLDNQYKHDVSIEIQNGNQYFIDEDLSEIVLSQVITTNPVYPPARKNERQVRIPQPVSEQEKPYILQSLVMVSLFSKNIPIKLAS